MAKSEVRLPILKYSKVDFEERLNLEGRSGILKAFREEMFKRYTDAGWNRSEAAHRVWYDAMEAFPPLGEDPEFNPPDVQAIPVPSASERLSVKRTVTEQDRDGFGRESDEPLIAQNDDERFPDWGEKTIDLAESVIWAFRHMEIPTRREEAPNPGAWVLLKYARKYPKDFIGTTLAKAYSEKAKAEAESKRFDRDVSLDYVLQILSDVAKGKIKPLDALPDPSDFPIVTRMKRKLEKLDAAKNG